MCAGTGSGYGSQNTGSTAENVKSYVPGTDANKESRYEQGRNTGSGYHSSNTSGNTGSGHAVRDAAAGIASILHSLLRLYSHQPRQSMQLLSPVCCSSCLSCEATCHSKLR